MDRRQAWCVLAALAGGPLLLAGCSSLPRDGDQAPPTLPEPPSRLSDEMADAVAIHALGLVGTPYRYGGNTPQGGFDCSGLIDYVFRTTAGLMPPRTVSRLQSWGWPVDRRLVRTGDLVLFGRFDAATHAGIYVGEHRFVHAPSTGGEVRLDDLLASYWLRQPQQFRRA